MGKLITGFDIGEATVKMTQVAGNEIKKAAVFELPDNIVEGDRIVSMDAMADFIREKSKEASMSRGYAAVILPASLSYVKNITVPMMTEQQLMFNLPFEFKDYLTEEKNKYLFDYAVLEVINGEDGQPYEMRIFACAVLRETIDTYKRMFARAGYKLKIAAPAECAYMNIMSKNNELSDIDLCVADLGHSDTTLHIFQKGEYAAKRNISMGLSDLDEIISRKEDVDIHMAHAYKESNYEGVITSPEATDFYASLGVEITKAVNFFNYNERSAELHDIYLCGGGAAIDPLVHTIEAETHMEIHTAQEFVPSLARASQPHALLESYGIATSPIKSAKRHTGKRMINMMNCGLPKKTARILSVGVILIILLVALVVKVGVIDQFSRLSAAETSYNAIHEQNVALDEKLVDYDEVSIQYKAYSKSFVTQTGSDGTEQSIVMVDRQDILDLIERKMASRGDIRSISINGNTAVVAMSGMNLKQISAMDSSLEDSPIVTSVTLKLAQTETEKSSNVMNFTVTIQLAAEEEE